MKALLCKAFGPPEELVLDEVPSLEPGPGEAIVRVRAAGVNFPDALVVQGKYQSRPPFPFSPGLEAAGTVLKLGEGVRGLTVGQTVIAMPAIGCYAEEVRVPGALAFPIPADIDPVIAGGFLVTYGTAHHALRDRARLGPGETLLVLGAAGGVGLAAVEIGRAVGATVIAAASTDEKLALCRDHGAAHLINYTTEDLRARLKEITDGRGVDVVFDPVAGPFAESTIRSLAWEGRYLVIGFAAGEIPKIPSNLLLLKGSSMLGVFWGAHVRTDPERYKSSIAEMLGWYREGKLRPHIQATYPLAQGAEALRLMLDRKAEGKLVVVP